MQLSYETSKWQRVVSTSSVALAATPCRLHDHAHCAPRRFLIKLCGPRFYSTLYYARYKPSKILPNSNCCIQAPASSTAFSSLSWYYFFIKYFWQKNGAGYIGTVRFTTQWRQNSAGYTGTVRFTTQWRLTALSTPAVYLLQPKKATGSIKC